MNMREKITRQLAKSTCDKVEFNRTVLRWKKSFDEAGKMLGGGKPKKK